MASLTHVCMWSDKGWKRIRQNKPQNYILEGQYLLAAACLCVNFGGQYVTLTDGDIRTRYFKLSAFEKSKDCPERTLDPIMRFRIMRKIMNCRYE